MGQLLPIIALSDIGSCRQTYFADETRKPFKPFKFDSSSVILGVDPTSDTGAIYNGYSFIIDNSEALNELKKGWILDKATDPIDDQRLFKIYYTRNKEIKAAWDVFPLRKSIITDNGYYVLDSLLTQRVSSRPLEYTSSKRIQYNSKAALVQLKNKLKEKQVVSLFY